MTPDGLTADVVVVDATNMDKLPRVAALNDDELLKAAAAVMDELRRRGLLFAATAAIVDWQDRWFLLEPHAAVRDMDEALGDECADAV
jgi:hypothetical protein